ncbi:MAG TPA: glutamine--fructose-6-phosphate transaminase (isomerizing) [Spirochaetia bacterium]|nr:glutamine--fructose-6-phosphate transaminase (isomerizing) [Spirochaetales bacterium]HRY79734.1 glutamine--fructose-6-phosphate transaminase (isomerizing) [Spirochaetia bacterium]HRZ88187.1 glutamine--fructose-6-phosphate transaminase (isomerizing) [Spirochaetia bacterium]
MCGIIGYTGPRKALPLLLQGLHLLEYRGYDSAGIALATEGSLRVYKKEGKLENLEAVLPSSSAAKSGIGHTRWATHGIVSDKNAHPHLGSKGRVAVAHNGILDNWAEIRRELESEGVVFTSDTDSEVIAQLVERELETRKPTDAVIAALKRISGTYGIAVTFADKPALVIGARNGSPLAIGLGDGEAFLASDPSAFASHTRKAVFLQDGDIAVLQPKSWEIRNLRGELSDREAETLPARTAEGDKGVHPDFFLKETFEQPQAVARALGNGGRLVKDLGTAKLGGLDMAPREIQGIREIVFVAMGTALHAAQIGARIVETWARIPSRAEDASELRSANPIVHRDALYVAVSQSGETADTLAAVREIQMKGGRTIGIVNGVGSTLARLCGSGIYVHAGPEHSVAATKSWSAQIVCCALLALTVGRSRYLSLGEGREAVEELEALPGKIEEALALNARVDELAKRWSGARSTLFLGRGVLYPAALEGALKLKEISYVHAEGFAGGALKHGPLALVSPEVPTFALLADGETFDRTLSNMSEVRARRGPVIAVTNREDPRLADAADEILVVPRSLEVLAPVLETIPLQLYARAVASELGRDVDRPRNLAKSVTTE